MLNTWLPINLFGFNKVVEFFRFAAAERLCYYQHFRPAPLWCWLAYMLCGGGREKNACWVITH